MSFAWLFNFDADFELIRPGHTVSTKLLADLEKHGRGAHALMGPSDVLARAGLAKMHLGRAWCPTPKAIEQLRKLRIEPEPHPTREVLRRVNHRLFAHELGGGLPNQHYVESRDALEPLFGKRAWLLKRPLSLAGRGQLRVSQKPDAKQNAWIDASLRHDGLIVEPLVTPQREFSLHGFVWRDGRFELGRVCEQQVDSKGVFRGVALAQNCAHEKTLVATAERVAKALADAGYFGPFGIDTYEYVSDFLAGGFCALSEINARYTMAFATGFPRPAHTLTL